MHPDELEFLRSWLSRAAEDLDAAAALSAAGPACIGSALFHCQQAAEKAAKAYLAYTGTPSGKTHDVSSLLDIASDTTSAFEPLRSAAATLTPYAVVYRYPGVTSPPTAEQLGQALSDAHAFFRTAVSLLPPEVSPGLPTQPSASVEDAGPPAGEGERDTRETSLRVGPPRHPAGEPSDRHLPR